MTLTFSMPMSIDKRAFFVLTTKGSATTFNYFLILLDVDYELKFILISDIKTLFDFKYVSFECTKLYC